MTRMQNTVEEELHYLAPKGTNDSHGVCVSRKDSNTKSNGTAGRNNAKAQLATVSADKDTNQSDGFKLRNSLDKHAQNCKFLSFFPRNFTHCI